MKDRDAYLANPQAKLDERKAGSDGIDSMVQAFIRAVDRFRLSSQVAE